MLHGVAALGDAPVDDGGLVAKTGSGQAEFEPAFREVSTAQVPKSDPFQMVPDPFIRLQLRGVSGQLLQMDARRLLTPKASAMAVPVQPS